MLRASLRLARCCKTSYGTFCGRKRAAIPLTSRLFPNIVKPRERLTLLVLPRRQVHSFVPTSATLGARCAASAAEELDLSVDLLVEGSPKLSNG